MERKEGDKSPESPRESQNLEIEQRRKTSKGVVIQEGKRRLKSPKEKRRQSTIACH